MRTDWIVSADVQISEHRDRFQCPEHLVTACQIRVPPAELYDMKWISLASTFQVAESNMASSPL